MTQPELFSNTMSSIDMARALKKEMRPKMEDGCQCPVCDQLAKIYKVKLNSGMARCLIWMYNRPQMLGEAYPHSTWVDIPLQAPREIIKSRSHGRLAHWGLIEAKPNVDDPSKKDSGLWRLTLKGLSFTSGGLRVPKHVFLYNNIVEGWSEEQTTIEEALGNHFNYEELMRGE